MSEDKVITAREIHLTDGDGNIAAILKAENATGDRDAAIVTISDKKGRPRVKIVIYDKDPGIHNKVTSIDLLDENGESEWWSGEPTIG